MLVEDVIKLFTESSLRRDGISFASVTVNTDLRTSSYVVSIVSDDPNVVAYEVVHPQFIANYNAALQGVNKCKQQSDCWNRNNTHEDEPWAFFPQFGLPMAMQRSVLMLNYPPSTALTGQDYLKTFTMNRWTRVLDAVGIDNPTLFETIVDIRPIAAPGSGTSQNLPDAQTYFNDPSGTTGGYYINPQLSLMVEPQLPNPHENTLSLVVLGTPAREDWNKITGAGEDILNTGTATIPGGSKPTPFILGNHPDVTTYQCCPGDPSSQCDSFDLVADEEIDMQIACWARSMSENPDGDPEKVLADCKEKWVTNRSADDDLTFTTDVNHAAPKGDADTEAHQQQRCGLGQRLRDAADVSQRAPNQRTVSLERIGAQHQQQQDTHQQSGQHCQQRQQCIDQFRPVCARVHLASVTRRQCATGFVRRRSCRFVAPKDDRLCAQL